MLAQSGSRTYYGAFTCLQTHFDRPKPSGECLVTPMTYPPLGKAFEKQTKSIDQNKQMKTTNGKKHGKQLLKSNGKKDSLKLLKQKEIFDELFNKRRF